jgi:hypothetical protein
MPVDLGRLRPKRMTGAEPFRAGSTALDFDLLSFWQWSRSDLLSNAARGVLAEYLVARALGVVDGIRDEWAAYDLIMPEGIKVEVKSAAFLQSWHQEKLSAISFRTPETKAWDPETNVLGDKSQRQADVYVFALLFHNDKATVDPQDVTQWEFYVVPKQVLNDRQRSQHSITLPSLRRLAQPVTYGELRDAVRRAKADEEQQVR